MDTPLSRQQTIPSEVPYKGLRSYEEEDQDYFFGRDADCDILIDKILTNRLTLLFAATGVGKSSLLQAAILPRLKDPTQEHLDVVYFRDWVERPLIELKRTVLRILQESGKLDAALQLEDIESSALKDFMQFCTLFTRPPLVVILDQFEEFFQYQRMRDTFQPFLQQLADVVTDRVSPVIVVIAMREDFALELNALKPYLPTLLFENFYRLERLTRKSAKDAIIRPVARVGFQYEDALVDTILTDLVTREQAGALTTPVTDLIETVEPPYLQITCSELWNIERHNPEKILRFETYKHKGGAQGLLRAYVENVLNGFSAAEKRLTSLAFNHLITRRGTKMAYTAPDLASLLGEDPQALGKVLSRLSTARILRSQSRRQVLWYELYHDLFSSIIETWNDTYKSEQRYKRALFGAGLMLVVLAALYAIYDATMNAFSHQVRLSVREVSDTLELYRGKAASLDIFRLQQYIAETGYHRAQLEPDKLFVQKPVDGFDRLNIELISLLPLEERIVAYWKSGHLSEALALAQSSISDDNVPRSQAIIDRVANFDSLRVLEILEERFQRIQTAYLRAKIATAVGSMGVPKGAVVLTAALNDPYPDVRRSAVQVLGRLGSLQAVPAVLERLTDPDAGVRWKAAEALGRLGSLQAVPAVLERLTDPDAGVRWRAAEALGRLGSLQAVPAVLERLTDPDADVRWKAAEALGRLGSLQVVPALLERLTDPDAVVRQSIVSALEQLGSLQVVPALLGRLTDLDAGVRWRAVEALGQLGSPQAIPALLERLTDPDADVRQSLGWALGQLGSPQVVPALLERLTDPDTPVRWRAIEALGQLGSPQAVPAILERLTDPDTDVRWRAMEALGRLGSPQAVPAILERLTDPDTVVRWKAVEALGQLGSPQVVPALLERLTDQSTLVRWSAAKALGQLGSLQVVPALLERLTDSDAGVRNEAVSALEQLGSPQVVPALLERLTDQDTPVRRSVVWAIGQLGSPQAVPALLERLTDPDADVRWRAMEALGRLGSPQAIPALLERLTDPDAGVRWRAVEALGRLGSPQAVPAILSASPIRTRTCAGRQ